MESTEAPNPFEGAATIDSATDVLVEQMSADEEPETAEESPNSDDAEASKEEVAEEPDAATEEAEEETEETDSDEEQPDESEETEEESDEEAQPETYTVTVQGEELEVSLDDLKSGYMRHEDYSRKTREVAEQRQTFYEQREQQEKATQAVIEEVGFLANELLNKVIGSEKEVEELRHLDPQEYAAKMAERQHQKELLTRAFQAHQQAQQNYGHLTDEMRQQHLQQQNDLLLSSIPEWADSTRASQEKRQLAEYLKGNGFTDEEVSQMADYRGVLISRKAMLYDQMQQTKQKAKSKVKHPVPKVRKANANTQSIKEQHKAKAKRRLKSEGSIDAAVELLMASGG